MTALQGTDAHADLFASQFDVRTITRASIAFCTCIEQSQEQEGIGVNANVIAAAREAFERTRNEAAKCVTGEGHTALAAHWSSFLVHANRVFTKLKQGAKSGPASRWWQDVEHIRKDDELLRYILHARNADEHGIKRIAPSIPATPIGISFGPFGARRVMKPECTVMVPVWDRGKRYDPPTTHLAQPLSIIRPNLNDMPTFMALESGTMERPEPFRDIAMLAVAYLAKIIEEAETFVTN